MTSVQDHYDHHLGPVYTWILGGFEPAIERGAAELNGIDLTRPDRALAVDLGAGFGMHAIPVARLGFNVLAVDSCAVLLDELEGRKGGLRVETVEADLRAFPRTFPENRSSSCAWVTRSPICRTRRL